MPILFCCGFRVTFRLISHLDNFTWWEGRQMFQKFKKKVDWYLVVCTEDVVVYYCA